MRVVMFVINSVAGDGRVVREASTLAADQHDVLVLGMREEGQAVAESLEGFSIRRVRRDPIPRDIGARVRRPGVLRRALAPLRNAWALLDYYLRAFRQATRAGADVYHAHDLVTLPVAWAAARRRHGRLVYDAHELFTEIGRLGRFPRAVFRVVERLLIGTADRIITVNESIAGELSRRYGVPPPTVIMNYPRTGGVRVGRQASPLRSRVDAPADAPLVLYQGMFMPHRGLENLIRASRLFDGAFLVFMGWGPLLADLRRLAQELGVDGRVRFIDGVPMSELLAFTAGADVGVIPYRNVGLNNYYTSPNKLFEYCAAGVPVVASRFPELIKVVEGLGVGRTFDPEDPADIASAVNGLLNDPGALGRARENVEREATHFTWERESRKLLLLYGSLGAP